MSETVVGFHEHEAQPEHHAPAPPPRGWHRLTAPGWLRVPWTIALFFGLLVPAVFRGRARSAPDVSR